MANVERKRGAVSALLDPMLLEGGRTVAEMAAVLAPQVGMTVAQLANNIRVRIFVLKARGYTVEKDVERKVKLTKPVETK